VENFFELWKRMYFFVEKVIILQKCYKNLI